MDADTLRRLEFHRIVDEVVRRTHFAPGAEEAARLGPVADLEACLRLQAETAEARAFLERQGGVPLGGLRDVREPLARAARGAVLAGTELLDVAQTAEGLAALRQALAAGGPWPGLRARAESLVDARDLAQAIRAAVAEDGSLCDDASPELRRLRQRRRELQAELRRRLEAFARSPEVQPYLQEPLVTLRGGRPVVPVRSEHRAKVPGLVHDVSASGATVFVEPAFAVELANRLREVEAAERREEERVLAALSARVAQRASALEQSLAVAASLDAAFARARLALDQRAVPPAFAAARRVELRAARHPLLGERAVPIDLHLGGDFDALVITGPNTGGKTVALKTLGLLCLMAQAGLQVPAERAELCVFRQVFADIGDEQSIEQSLSTFAAHLRTLVEVVRRADDRTLVLVDELGAGTDPEEGAALGLALLDALLERGALVAVTTHIGRLKTYAYERPRVANASVEFDPETLRPTYRLLLGVPGRSHALTVARRLGLPEAVVRRAEEYLGASRLTVDEAIARLERERRAAEQERAEAARARAEAERLRAEWRRRLEDLDARRRQWLEQARAELTARLNRIQEEAERLAAELRSALAAGARDAEPEAALQRLRALRAEAHAALAEAAPPEPELPPLPPERLRPGTRVRVRTLGQVGEVLEPPRAGRPATVQVGSLRLQVPAESLLPADDEDAPAPAPPPPSPPPLALRRAQQIAPELHLRGMTVDEALEALDRYLDDALLAGLGRARIVHGKGTGALRAAVHRFLQGDRRVRSFRLGTPGEGGSGVTVVEIDA